MTPDNPRELIAEARRWANGHPNRRSGELMRDLADALAALTTGQGIDAPSVREAIGEVLADMGAVIEGMPVASDLAALTEITDAAIRAAVSPPSRTAKRTGYETVGHAVGEHSQTIRATAALTAPQEGARDRLAEVVCLALNHQDGGQECEANFVVADAILAAFPVLSRAAAPEPQLEWHYGRSWVGTRLEDDCPCEKQPCGLVTFADAGKADCPQHAVAYSRTMRQSHLASNCPGKPHTEHVHVAECWPRDCLEGECEHRDEDGQPEDMTACPATPMEVCVGCMVDSGSGAEPSIWEDAPLYPWPCEKPGPLPVGGDDE